ncbi:HAD family hydrolase [Hippea jasoniae]|uniref:HAD family hydrolase n=1 Tax=Hippea jasoniae TaxID=944479 RepID=UPI000551FDD0|nr:HAD family hydrolase [Hippea jasoniae]
MIEVEIPGFGKLKLKYAVFDFNGTLACDGVVKAGIKHKLNELSKFLDIHVVTADTNGTAKVMLIDVNATVVIAPSKNQDLFKAKYIESLNGQLCVAVGNGNNDRLMFKKAALSICVIGCEGAFIGTIKNSSVVVAKPEDAINLLINKNRLIATLRR